MSQPEIPKNEDASAEGQMPSTPAPMSPVEKPITDPTRHLDALEAMVAADQPAAPAPAAAAPVAAPAVPDDVKPVEGVQRNNIKQDTHIDLDPFSTGKNRSRPEVLTTPVAPFDETLNRLASITAGEVEGRPQYAYWASVAQSSMSRMSYAAAADDIFARAGSTWVQRLNYGNTKIGQSGAAFNFADGEILSGEQALMAAQRHVGIGGDFTTVLPHSGFWMTMKPPMEESILELHRQINQIKTEVGRKTYGLLLGAESGLINELFVRFALTAMKRNSIKDVDNILDTMSVHDINILIWGYLCTIYPNGFNHRAACMADTTKCQHVVEDLINVRRLFFMDKSKFSDEMLAHLSSTSAGSMPLEKIAEYRKQLKKLEERRIIVNEGQDDEVAFDLRVPSAREYFESTHRWIDGIGDKVIEALGADSSFSERNTLINEHAASTQMRKFAHWVDKIYIGGGIVTRESSGPEGIEKILDAFSSSMALREEFSEKVQEYIKDTCIGLIGIPDFKCPNCGQYQITEEETAPLHRSIVGIDVAMTFFTVLVLRAQSIRE
jgi:hypothetical protein